MIRIEPMDMPLSAELDRTRLSRYLLRARRAVGLDGQVDVLLTDDKTIKRLNRDFRGKNKATDVLSFPAGDFVEGLAGDLAVSLDTAARQARRFGLTLEEEVKTLLLHGILHLAGYDHEVDNGEMAEEEQRLRAKLRLPSSLIARVEGGRA